VAESWAQYIGTRNASARYPTGMMTSVFFGGFPVSFNTALEQETWFFNNWIPTGVYNDLSDVFNTAFEPWDNTGGASVQMMYDVFDSDVDTMCEYQERFLGLYRTVCCLGRRHLTALRSSLSLCRTDVI
jgi:hypothetical protein